MSAPFITVLMCVHNGGRWLRESVASILAQTRRDFEFLIIDDASTDDSAAQIERVKDERVRLIRLPENIGLTRSLNVGLREARGEWIARQDADDVSMPQRLEQQSAFLQSRPEAVLVGSQARLIDQNGGTRGVRNLPLEPNGLRWLSLVDNPVIHTAAMFRRAVILDELGGYDESFPCCQDYDLWARVLERGPVWNLPERLVQVREHAASISATRQSEAQTMVRRVVRRLAEQWLPELALDDAQIALLCAFRRHLAPDEICPFHALLSNVETALAGRFPGLLQDAEVRRTKAAMYARIGYNLVTRDRGLALSEFRHALAIRPAVALEIPWLRVAALFCLGERVRCLRA